MKNLNLKYKITTTTFCLLTLASIFAFTFSNNEDSFSMEVGLEFGKGINCTGRGLCTFTSTEKAASSDFDALGFYSVDKGGSTTLKIDKTTISYAKAVEQFNGEKFEISENLIMQNVSTRKSPNGKIPILKKGEYPVREDQNFMIIDFSK